MNLNKINLKLSLDDDLVGYLYLPYHPRPKVPKGKIIEKTISLSDLITDYKGPAIYLDFDKDDLLIGIEILG